VNPYRERYLGLHKTTEKKKHEAAFLFQIQSLGIKEPVQQFKFRETRKWRVDFAWPERKLAVEIEGGIWRRGGGAHSHPVNIERDIDKGNALAMAGYHLLRFTDKHIRSGEGVQTVKAFLIQKELDAEPAV